MTSLNENTGPNYVCTGPRQLATDQGLFDSVNPTDLHSEDCAVKSSPEEMLTLDSKKKFEEVIAQVLVDSNLNGINFHHAKPSEEKSDQDGSARLDPDSETLDANGYTEDDSSHGDTTPDDDIGQNCMMMEVEDELEPDMMTSESVNPDKTSEGVNDAMDLDVLVSDPKVKISDTGVSETRVNWDENVCRGEMTTEENNYPDDKMEHEDQDALNPKFETSELLVSQGPTL